MANFNSNVISRLFLINSVNSILIMLWLELNMTSGLLINTSKSITFINRRLYKIRKNMPTIIKLFQYQWSIITYYRSLSKSFSLTNFYYKDNNLKKLI